ncbi:MAG: Na(+)-translocating NADH-quinone reductase subunit C [Gammaproteobacteria bacterium]|nr:Na(+)-translocating NADH-quinone reductase subunit C [Gammaproteobacteria bacterium]MDH5629244.1 Na(+)-translocating NADH-quinone reductase subunit C [Gammaproteobacteria bacterium]
MSASNESFFKTVLIAVSLCLVCSVLVTSSAVILKDKQKSNALLDKKRNVLIAANLYKEGIDIEQAFASIDQQFVDLKSGQLVELENAVSYDQRKAAKNIETSHKPQKDIARIGRQANIASIYLVKGEQGIESIILPVHGKGLFSTMYGFLAIKSDKKTVIGLKFYEQGETPGLGGEVENPKWLALWQDKQLFDDKGNLALELVKGSAQNQYQIDALSGATMTTRGLQNMIDFWLGEEGFGPFLSQLQTNQLVKKAGA